MDEIASHCAEIDRCNQRGGRMLSVFDLIEAETLSLDLAAWLMERIGRGESFWVGARPGGAGKTTVMGALLNLIPAETRLVAATRDSIGAIARSPDASRTCAVCHEIGAGAYFGYLWGQDLRAYCALADRGCQLAANLHADDPQQARAQLCDQNGASEAQFQAFRLQLYLRVEGGWGRARRRIERVYASDGRSAHRLAFDASQAFVAPGGDGFEERRDFLRQASEAGVRRIVDARRAIVEFHGRK